KQGTVSSCLPPKKVYVIWQIPTRGIWMGLLPEHHLYLNNYIIRAPLGESAVSCVYAFLPGKSQEIFEEMLTAVHDKGEELGFYMDVTTTITDFEQAALHAISNKLDPHVNPKACFYHLTQSTWRKIQSLGLRNRYKEDDNIKHFCGMLDGLAFLLVDCVSYGMDYIEDNTPDGLEDLVDYFDANYVTGTYQTISRSCDNASAVDSSIIPTREMECYFHPTIWTAIECIRKDAAIVSMQLTLDTKGQPLQKRVRRDTKDLQKQDIGGNAQEALGIKYAYDMTIVQYNLHFIWSIHRL
ncbi:putative Inosine-5'-monophosphate dehydrogenase 1b-like 15, partial [Homarus americanus]